MNTVQFVKIERADCEISREFFGLPAFNRGNQEPAKRKQFKTHRSANDPFSWNIICVMQSLD